MEIYLRCNYSVYSVVNIFLVNCVMKIRSKQGWFTKELGEI